MIDLIDVPFGNRFVGFYGENYGNQVPVTSKKEIVDVIEEHLGIDNLAISICTYKDNKPHLLFLPFDFDSDDLRESWDDAIKLYNFCVENNYSAYLTFSGRKGFHVFIVTEIKSYSKRQIKDVQSFIGDILKLKTIDTQIMGDVRRLMRIPGTYNIKGGLCRILSLNEGERLDLDMLSTIKYEPDYEPYTPMTTFRNYHKYPCIEDLISNKEYWYKHHPRGKFEPHQKIRFTWAILRLSEGYTMDEIIEEAESLGWDDWDEGKTRSQIEHIDMNQYVPHSCRTLKSLGYCTGPCKYDTDIKIEDIIK